MKIGIEEFEAQVMPERKKELIEQLRQQGYVVAMIGDGMNDSPALSWADVGISMSHGADLAKEAADVVLLSGRLETVIEGRKISQIALSRIRQNFWMIHGINTSLIFLSVAGLLPPIVSALAHNGTTLLVSANSLRPYPL